MVAIQAPITGAHGVWLRPDQSLADMEPLFDYHTARILILPRLHECIMKLLFNPRVHELVERVFRDGGLVAAVSPKTRDLLLRSGLAVPESEQCFLFQGQATAVEFIEQLVAQAQFSSPGA